MFGSDQRFRIIQELQKYPQFIRNISIIAHVDHGKTTLSDSLISSNNIISKKLVGKLRYLDSRPDEQERCITMKSSSISLIFNYEQQDHLINLIDSPGHVEFGSEVSSALRLTDGALILVDIIEGVSSQTYTVLKQAYDEKVQCILVLNKIDRLIHELQMDPYDAYRHLQKVIDQVNAILSSFIATDIENKNNQDNVVQNNIINDKEIDAIENKMYFSPEKNNVIFCSAVDCWAFRLKEFAKLFQAKLGCKPDVLTLALWGDYYYQPKTKQVSKKPVNDKQLPMFVEFILKNIWNAYDIIKNKEFEKLNKMTAALNIEIPDKLRNVLMKDSQQMLYFIMNSWLPIEKVVLSAVVELMPSPKEAQTNRLDVICRKLIKAGQLQNIQNIQLNDPLLEVKQRKWSNNSEGLSQLVELKNAICNCDNSDDAPVVIFISKMVPVPKENINEHGLNEYTQNINSKIKFIGFARIFSGVIKRGSKVFVIGPKGRKKYQNDIDKKNSLGVSTGDQYEIQQAQIDNIYILMAQYLEGTTQITAGNVFGVGNLDNIVFKTATLSSNPDCPSFTPINLGAQSLLKVSINTETIEDYPKLVEGLKKLNKADPSVEVYTSQNGDLILSTCGEVHLERCINDLERTLAQVKVKVSEPIVSFKEAITYNNLHEINNKTNIEEAQKKQNKKSKNEGKIENSGNQLNNIEEVQTSSDEDEQQKQELLEKRKQAEGTEVTNVSEIMKEDFWDWQDKKLTKKQTETKQKVYKLEPKNVDNKKNSAKFMKNSKINIINLRLKTNLVEQMTPNGKFKMKLRGIGVNFEFAEWIEKNQNMMGKMLFDNKGRSRAEVESFIALFQQKIKEFIEDQDLYNLMMDNLVVLGPKRYGPNFLIIKGLHKKDNIFSQLRQKVLEYEEENQAQQQIKQIYFEEQKTEEDSQKEKDTISVTESEHIILKNPKLMEYVKQKFKVSHQEIIRAIITGFDLAVSSGPLCEEPMMGVCFIVEDLNLVNQAIVPPSQIQIKDISKSIQSNIQLQEQLSEDPSSQDKQFSDKFTQIQTQELQKDYNNNDLKQDQVQEQKEQCDGDDKNILDSTNQIVISDKDQSLFSFVSDPYGPLTGQIISITKEGCLQAFQGSNPRLVEGMYLCDLQTEQLYYGKVYDVLNKRRAVILEEDLNENSNLYFIKAHLPIVESQGFYSEMLKQTSGRVNAQLNFDTWKILDIDPFYVPQTLEEIEEHGDQILQANLAKTMIDKIRKRKGIFTEEKIVVAAEKQRTLSKTK